MTNPLRKRWTWRAARVVGISLSATALGPLLPVDTWWVRLGDFPRVQLLVGYLVALAALIPFWRRVEARWWAAVLVLCVGIQLYWILPYLPVAPNEVEWAQSNDESARLRIVTANVLQDNESAGALLTVIEEENPDVVVLCEVNSRWLEDLAPLKQRYPFQLARPLENKYGIALYTRLELLSAEVRAMVKEGIPSIDARLRLRCGHEARLFAVHPNPPRPGEDTTKRDAELVLVAREVRDEDTAIVLGDMNDVGWSRTTNLFQEVGGLLDPRKGRGLYPTFNAESAIWRYPLDHLFHSEDFRVVELATLPYIGSDHFPLLVELSHEPRAHATQEPPDLDADDREDAEETTESVRRS